MKIRGPNSSTKWDARGRHEVGIAVDVDDVGLVMKRVGSTEAVYHLA